MAKPDHHFGLHAIEALLNSTPELVLTLFVQQGRDDQRMQTVLLLAKRFSIPVQRAARETLNRLAEGTHHQGIVAAVKAAPVKAEAELWQLLAAQPRCWLLVLDQVTDPHNLGACIRTAAAMGVHAVIVPRDRAAGLSAVVRKVAAGGVDQLDFIQVTNLARTLEGLRERQVHVVGTILNEQAKPIDQCQLDGALAIVMGAEDTGLRRLTQENCDELAYIPMQGKLQSLNVSVATGMALYEASRQRHAST